jgi:non-heme chloroperoxidase
MMVFLSHGVHVIVHDRRGHGRSTQIATGHDMEHYADDSATLVQHRPKRRDPRRSLDRS